MVITRGIEMSIAVVNVPGIGPKTAEYLEKQGITTAEALLEAGVEVLALSPGFGDARARKVMDAAAALVVGAEAGESPIMAMVTAEQIKGTKAKKAGKKGKKEKKKEKGKKAKQKVSAKRKGGKKKRKGSEKKKKKGKK
jgi:hypothetical protein